jgi:ketosteroid isomerase-like protein
MGEAREVMDRLTGATETKDFRAVAECYADNATAVTPDQGNFEGATRSQTTFGSSATHSLMSDVNTSVSTKPAMWRSTGLHHRTAHGVLAHAVW